MFLQGQCLVYMDGDEITSFDGTVYHLKRNMPSTQCEKYVTFKLSSSTVSPTSTYRIKMHTPEENPLRLYIGDFLQGTLLRVILTPLGSVFEVNLHPGDNKAMEEGAILMHFKVDWGIYVDGSLYQEFSQREQLIASWFEISGGAKIHAVYVK
ncbi:unnamed protein product [Cylicocyclus nassatus]|uniref:Uncharacterized protein n=1 Tax=Cylicocyclus nassatus TaxID=53992 RepID=A0AA36GW00_CYLNA|nr:unnamed protein product [Cylicocyclus nassatus]